MSNYDAYQERRTCPYCHNDQCEADWVDVGIGLVQCSPFYCDNCGACEIGGYDEPAELTEEEKKFHWYQPGRAYLTCAPTVLGVPVEQETAKIFYEAGMLDKKDIEPHYEVDLQTPRWRPGEEGNLTMTITVRGTPYTFPARRMACLGCDGGMRIKLGLHVHGGVCYCDKLDYTYLDFDHDKMNEEQKETVAMYHLDLQVSSYF